MLYKTINLTDIYCGHAAEELKLLPSESVHCVVTSPPYFGLRSYLDKDDPNKKKEIGLEQSPEEYVNNLVCLFREVKRVLRKDGTVFLNLGDSFVDKQLQGIPWRVAFALQADGWYLRMDIIWGKKHCLPESVTDRCVKAHEYVFLLAKSEKYFFDHIAIREETTTTTKQRLSQNVNAQKGSSRIPGKTNGNIRAAGDLQYRNKRSIWWVSPAPYKGAHFATMPPLLIEPCILAGTSEKGCCASCGSPYVRKEKITGTQITEQMLACGSDKEGNYTGQATKEYTEGKAQNPSDTKRRILESLSKVREYYFDKSCKCETEEVKPCIVLDPFGGSGTTAWVANSFGRKAVVIELNEKYIPLIEERIQTPYLVNKGEKKKVKKSPAQPCLPNLFEAE